MMCWVLQYGTWPKPEKPVFGIMVEEVISVNIRETIFLIENPSKKSIYLVTWS